jgi:hypothetical protein
LLAALALVSNVRPSVAKQDVRSCILLNGIDLPLVNEWRDARNLVVLLEVEERVDAKAQVALDKIANFASGLYLAAPFRICEYPAVDHKDVIRGKYKFADYAV